MTRLQTLDLVPAVDGHRFRAAVSLGGDRCGTIRDEFVLLRAVAALLCGVAPEQLQRDHLTDLHTALAGWRARLAADDSWRHAAIAAAGAAQVDTLLDCARLALMTADMLRTAPFTVTAPPG